MGSDAEYMLENGIDPFYYRDDNGMTQEYEGGINPIYDADIKDSTTVTISTAAVNDAMDFIMRNIGWSYVCRDIQAYYQEHDTLLLKHLNAVETMKAKWPEK